MCRKALVTEKERQEACCDSCLKGLNEDGNFCDVCGNEVKDGGDHLCGICSTKLEVEYSGDKVVDFDKVADDFGGFVQGKVYLIGNPGRSRPVRIMSIREMAMILGEKLKADSDNKERCGVCGYEVKDGEEHTHTSESGVQETSTTGSYMIMDGMVDVSADESGVQEISPMGSYMIMDGMVDVSADEAEVDNYDAIDDYTDYIEMGNDRKNEMNIDMGGESGVGVWHELWDEKDYERWIVSLNGHTSYLIDKKEKLQSKESEIMFGMYTDEYYERFWILIKGYSDVIRENFQRTCELRDLTCDF